ncbi:hypothetical protein L596_022043 [Steinernema carpocapsae]|uniref:Uncharacterized protein n=1 Tax=Steinernema carpocapsae TaxID=34508 RepID=A0A4U5MKL4_STECR|nr:hypothetical protein L596_022043 [Steinernema carpocapsae]
MDKSCRRFRHLKSTRSSLKNEAFPTSRGFSVCTKSCSVVHAMTLVFRSRSVATFVIPRNAEMQEDPRRP